MSGRPTRWRRLAGLAGAVVVAAAGTVGTEILVARRGPAPPMPPAPPASSAVGPPGEGGEVIVWLGDSTAAGVGASAVSATVAGQVASRLGETGHLTVVAVSGARVADVVRDQLAPAVGLRPTVAFISVGANDTVHLTSVGAFRRAYTRLLDGLPDSVRTVVLLGVPDMGAPPRLMQPLRAIAGWRGRRLDAEVAALARRRHLVYVDIAGATGPAFRRHPGSMFAGDHYHPSDAGYARWAAAVVNAVHAAGRSA